MKKRFFLRIFISLFFVSIISLFSFLLFSVKNVKAYSILNEGKHIEKVLLLVSYNILPDLSEKNFDTIDSIFKSISNSTGYRITLIDKEGKVLLDTDENPKKMSNHSDRPEIEDALLKGKGKSVRFSITKQKNLLYVATLLKIEEKIFVLRVSTPLSDIDKSIKDFYSGFILIFFIIISFMLVISLFITKNVYQPIDRLVHLAGRVSEGDFSVRALIFRNDEIKNLAESFNLMIERIEELFSRTREQRDEMNKIIMTMQEGVMVIDKNGEIVLSNSASEKIFFSTDLNGKNIREVIKNMDFLELFSKSALEKKDISGEIKYKDQNIVLNFGYIDNLDEIVATFFDITQIRKVDRLRKEFIVNASHELRTPLTAMKGFIETMMDTVDETNKKYLKILEKHTDRLIHIVEDLLTLSYLENLETLEKEETDLVGLTDNIIKIMKPKAEKKGLKFYFEYEKLPKISVDIFKMEQVLINLIDNAIRYTEEGYIKVLLKHYEKNIFIEVEDTGIGINQKDMERIFERFYVVDKSRSKKSGGTGLGLAIVKHIVLLHEGKIYVESGGGKTKFTVELKLDR